MTDYVVHGDIKIAKSLHDLVRDEVAPGTGIAPEAVWTLLDTVVSTLSPRNRALLAKRDRLQATIDRWLAARRGQPLGPKARPFFMKSPPRPAPAPESRRSSTRTPRLPAAVRGPRRQPRYALNAANGLCSLRCPYGTNVITADGGARARQVKPGPRRARDRQSQSASRRDVFAGARWQITGHGRRRQLGPGKRRGPPNRSVRRYRLRPPAV
jgi:malate synthase